jgi:hypothetical protein
MGSPAVPTAAQWQTLKQAAQLTHFDSVTTVTLPGKSWTKTFLQKNYSVGLIIITRDGPSKVTKAPEVQGTMFKSVQAKVIGTNMHVELQGSGTYQIRLFSVTGRTIMKKQAVGPGDNVFSLKDVPAGTYLVQCENGSKTQVMPVIIGR